MSGAVAVLSCDPHLPSWPDLTSKTQDFFGKVIPLGDRQVKHFVNINQCACSRTFTNETLVQHVLMKH